MPRLRQMKLKRGAKAGIWRSADGRWEFQFMPHSRAWYVYHASDIDSGEECETATFTGFDRLWEATDWASKQPV
jgi:hypothetical protein